MSIEFKNPPADTRGRQTDSYDIAEALKAAPGEWACIGRRSTSTAGNIKAGLAKAYRPAGSFEAVTRGGDGKTSDIYVRYVGKPDAAA